MRGLILCVCLGLSCHPLTGHRPGGGAPAGPAPPPAQTAPAAEAPAAVVPAAHSAPVAASPTPPEEPAEPDGLSLAAGCIQSGDDAGAVPHLLAHLRAHPDQIMIRAYLAELLLRLGRAAEARGHFERFVADAQEQDGPARKHLVHCHTRLMEIARQEEDEYAEHLHRGIGLLLLAEQSEAAAGKVNPSFREQILCKAAAELTGAHDLRPGEARASWYLYETWKRLGQRQPAETALRSARAAAAFSTLTPAERRDLALAAPVAGWER